MSDVVIIKLDDKFTEEVHYICTKCFNSPWSKENIENELTNNLFSNYLGAFINSNLVGFVGMWAIVNEGQITNIAVLPEYRCKKIATKLLEKLVSFSKTKNIEALYLEVRFSNLEAQNLYRKFGFKTDGIRKKYYSDNNEDAILMSKILL